MNSGTAGPGILPAAAAFLGGVAALLFQTLMFRQAGIAFGVSQWAGALTLAGFMAGLGIGNLLAATRGTRIRRLLRAYIRVEGGVAVGGIMLILLFPGLANVIGSWLSPLRDAPLALNLARFGIALGLFALPVVAMGAALPLWVRYCEHRHHSFGQTLGNLYGWNTLGGVAGACLGEAFLIALGGIPGTALFAALCNMGAIGCAVLLGRSAVVSGAGDPAAEAGEWRWSWATARILIAAAISGAILLGLEVTWFRFLQLFVLDTHLHFALMLAVVLAGIALGGLAGGWWLRDVVPDPERGALVAVFAGLATIACFLVFSPGEGGEVSHWHVEWPSILRLCVILMFVPAFLSGLLFTWLGALLYEECPQSAAATGWLTFANTLGAALGALAAGFLLLPEKGMQITLLGLAILYGFVPLLLWRPRAAGGSPAFLFAGVIALAVSALGFPRDHVAGFLLQATEKFRAEDGSATARVHEGRLQTIQYLRKDFFSKPLYYRLVTNGYSMSATTRDSRRYMKFFAWWPAVVHGEVRDALLISYGIGMTGQALVRLPGLEKLDVVDVSADILETSGLVFAGADNPLNDPRVRVHVEDGRFFLHQPPRGYDLITGEPPPPRASGVVNLYTREYFGLVRGALNPGGVVTYWLPVDQMRVDSARAVLAAFCAVFEDCALWAGSNYNWMMTGSRGRAGPVAHENSRRLWRNRTIHGELLATGFERPEALPATFIADAATLREWIAGQPALSDWFPLRLSPDLPRQNDLQTYFQWMDDVETERRFMASEYIDQMWSLDKRQAIRPWFAYQSVLNNQVRPGTLQALQVLEPVLEASPLRVPVLWLLDSDLDRLRIVDQSRSISPEATWHRAASAVVQRDYAAAAELLESIPPGEGSWFRQAAAVYVLCRAERPEAAQAVAAAMVAADGQPSPYRCW